MSTKLSGADAIAELRAILQRIDAGEFQCDVVADSASGSDDSSAEPLTEPMVESAGSAEPLAESTGAIVPYSQFDLSSFIAPLIGWFRRYIAPIFIRRIVSRTPQLDSYPIKSLTPQVEDTLAITLVPNTTIYHSDVIIKNRGFADISANVTRPPGIMNEEKIYETLLWYNAIYPHAQIDPDSVICRILAVCRNFAVVRAIVIYNIAPDGMYHILYKYENQTYAKMIRVYTHTDSDLCWNVYAIKVNINYE